MCRWIFMGIRWPEMVGNTISWSRSGHQQPVSLSLFGSSFTGFIHHLPVSSLCVLKHYCDSFTSLQTPVTYLTIWNFRQCEKKCRSHTVWLIFIKCSNTTEITAHGEVKYQRALSSRRLAFQQESLRKDAVKLEGKEQSDKQTSSANPFDSGELALCETGKNGSSNYQRTQWDCFLHAGWHFDLRGNNESNQKLMPALPLGSQPIRGMFTHRLWGPPCFCLASCPLSGSVTVTMIKRRQTACERSY